jgi:hypothetical protein
MRKITMLSGLCLFAIALAPLSAQTFRPDAPYQTASLFPYPPIWGAAAAAEYAGTAFQPLPGESTSSAPPVTVEFAAIFAVPCSDRIIHTSPERSDGGRDSCQQGPNLDERFLNTPAPAPLTPEQKAGLALHNLKDPGNLVTIADIAAFTIGTNSHTAYGPGFRGFTRNVGYSYLQEATGEFLGTFLIPSIAHEDPRYHRMPSASVPRRIVHAVAHTFVSQSDAGKPIPNYSALLTYPVSAEISNLYVPGINGNGPSTVRRIVIGYATDPIDNLVTEFLPDVARRIHVRVIFVQRVLNQVSSDQYSLP